MEKENLKSFSFKAKGLYGQENVYPYAFVGSVLNWDMTTALGVHFGISPGYNQGNFHCKAHMWENDIDFYYDDFSDCLDIVCFGVLSAETTQMKTWIYDVDIKFK